QASQRRDQINTIYPSTAGDLFHFWSQPHLSLVSQCFVGDIRPLRPESLMQQPDAGTQITKSFVDFSFWVDIKKVQDTKALNFCGNRLTGKFRSRLYRRGR